MISETLLATKLYIPSPRASVVARPRLTEKLNAGLGGKLTLVSAPAGFGKTTLLSDWVAGHEHPVSWLSLDEGDNDPQRFMAYFVAALKKTEAKIGSDVPEVFRSSKPAAIEAVMGTLINEISTYLVERFPNKSWGPEQVFVLILDDYHAIQAQPVHDVLTFFINRLPQKMHLVLTTRTDPPLPIARLRARGELTELRQSDLRFTTDETAEFLNQVMGLGLSAGDVAALATRTEGWIAGLQMAAVSMQGRPDAAAFVQAFTGSNRYILDYLVEEVLQRQDEPLQKFLLQTSILERMCGSLCDAILGEGGISDMGSGAPSDSLSPDYCSSSQEILEYLEHANLFLVPLDDRREWYRYHHLFAEFLHNRLNRDLPGEEPSLHRRAAAWFEENGFSTEAVEHALRAGNYTQAANLIEQVADGIVMRSQVRTLLNWIQALPEEEIRARPSLCVFYAWALLLSGHSLDTVEARLRDADRHSEQIPGRAAVLRAFIAAFQGNVPRAVELSQQALKQMPEEDPFIRSAVAWNLGISQAWSGDLKSGIQSLQSAVDVGLEVGNLMVAVVAMSHLAEIHMMLGELHKAQSLYHRALELAVDGEGRTLPVAGSARIGLGEVLRKRNELKVASEQLEEGLRLTQQWGEIGRLDGYIALARVKQARGETEGAQQELQKAQELARRFDTTEMDDFLVDITQANLWISQGNLEAARQCLEAHRLTGDLKQADIKFGEGENLLADFYLGTLARLALARLFTAQGQPEEVPKLLKKPLSTAREHSWNDFVIEIQILLGAAFQMIGKTSQGLVALEEALSLTEQQGYVRVFLDAGEPMAVLLSNFVKQRPDDTHLCAYARELLAAFDSERRDRIPELQVSQKGAISPLIEPLSKREMEVLGLIAAGLSNREIAARLYLAISTVKTHINNIYRKLNVSKRTQAVARARELDLL